MFQPISFLVLVLFFSFSFSGQNGFAEQLKKSSDSNEVLLDRLEAAVNSSPILLSDVDHFKKSARLRSQLDPLFAGTKLAEKGSSAPKNEIVEFLINDKLISQQFPVSDSEVEQEINSIQTNNRIDRAKLKAALADQGFSFDDYFELIRSSASKRNLIDRDIRSKVLISEEDIKNYFYNHYTRKNSALSRSFHIQIISVSTKNYKSKKFAYDIILRALNDIKKGEAFNEVAKKVSDDPTASSGGDLGMIEENQISAKIRDQVKKLDLGGVSEIFEIDSPQRYVILKLVDVNSDDSAQYKKLKNEIQNQLSTKEFQYQIAMWLERQHQLAFVHKAGESSVKEIAVPSP